MQRCGNQIALVHVPGTGADLNRLSLSDIELAYQHMVGVGMLLQLEDTANFNILQARRQIFGDLDLGARNTHRLCEGFVIDFFQAQVHKFIEPFSR
jgi:hypothetical protein